MQSLDVVCRVDSVPVLGAKIIPGTADDARHGRMYRRLYRVDLLLMAFTTNLVGNPQITGVGIHALVRRLDIGGITVALVTVHTGQLGHLLDIRDAFDALVTAHATLVVIPLFSRRLSGRDQCGRGEHKAGQGDNKK